MWVSLVLKAWGWTRTLIQSQGPLLAAVALAIIFAVWLHHRGYERGYAAAEAEYQAAVQQASQRFAEQLAARDRALAEAQGRVVEVVKWRTRTETRYREALRTDPACGEWARQRIACPLGLQVDAAPGGDGLPADPARPH